jgi:hypothetical protein
MKKGFYVLFILGIIFCSVFYMGFLPKGTACKLACETALKECKEKAEKNELKEAACEAAYEECLEGKGSRSNRLPLVIIWYAPVIVWMRY